MERLIFCKVACLGGFFFLSSDDERRSSAVIYTLNRKTEERVKTRSSPVVKWEGVEPI